MDALETKKKEASRRQLLVKQVADNSQELRELKRVLAETLRRSWSRPSEDLSLEFSLWLFWDLATRDLAATRSSATGTFSLTTTPF